MCFAKHRSPHSNLPVTKIVDALMNNKESAETEGFQCLDPKSAAQNARRMRQSNMQHQEAFVFVLGGGNYIEHQNLQDYAKNQVQAGAAKTISYATTEIVAPEQFLAQLSGMGKEHVPAVDLS